MPASLPGVPGAPDLGGGLSGLGGQIAQALDGLFTGTPDAPPDPLAPDPVDRGVDEPQPAAEPPVDESKDPDAESDSPDPPADESADTEQTDTVPPPAEPAAEGAAPPVAEPPPPPAPAPVEELTPCQIAADELPQVGQ
jgi:hypothetical protein